MKHTHKKVTTIVNFILDKSGSMSSIRDRVIDGFNEYIAGLKNKKNVDFRLSLTLFDSDSIEKRYITKPIKEIEPLTRDTYVPGSMTPLYDAVVDTVETVREEIKDMEIKPVIVTVIMTDGAENASTKHDHTCLRELKERLEKEGNWTFTFMGANQDAWATAQRMGFNKGNVLSWQSTDKGTVDAYDSLLRGTTAYAMSAAAPSAQEDIARGSFQSKNFFDTDSKVKGGAK